MELIKVIPLLLIASVPERLAATKADWQGFPIAYISYRHHLRSASSYLLGLPWHIGRETRWRGTAPVSTLWAPTSLGVEQSLPWHGLPPPHHHHHH